MSIQFHIQAIAEIESILRTTATCLGRTFVEEQSDTASTCSPDCDDGVTNKCYHRKSHRNTKRRIFPKQYKLQEGNN
jgi:hypothetical protein